MNINNLKRRCEELIKQGYGEAEVYYYKDYFHDRTPLGIFTPDQYYASVPWSSKKFPNDSKEFVLIDEEE